MAMVAYWTTATLLLWTGGTSRLIRLTYLKCCVWLSQVQTRCHASIVEMEYVHRSVIIAYYYSIDCILL